MFHLLAVLLPLATAAAVSPVVVTEQAVLLAAPGGRRAAALYAAGTALVLAVLVGVVVTVGRSFSLPRAPRLDGTLDLLLGVVLMLVALGLRVWGTRRKPVAKLARTRMRPGRALGFGAVSMATNVTSLALVVPAAKEISASGVGTLGIAIAAVLLVVTVTVPAWGPVAITTLSPGPAGRLLPRVQRVIDRYGAVLVVVLVAAAGVFFVGRGILRVTGL